MCDEKELSLVLKKFSASPFRKEKITNVTSGRLTCYILRLFFLQHLPSGNEILICISKVAPIGFDYISKNT